jgi:hypothetical protein
VLDLGVASPKLLLRCRSSTRGKLLIDARCAAELRWETGGLKSCAEVACSLLQLESTAESLRWPVNDRVRRASGPDEVEGETRESSSALSLLILFVAARSTCLCSLLLLSCALLCSRLPQQALASFKVRSPFVTRLRRS